MSDYIIGEILYNQALDEICSDFLANNLPCSVRTRTALKQEARAHAEQLFSQIWGSAVRINKRHKAGIAKRIHSNVEPFDESMYPSFRPETLKNLRKLYDDRRADLEEDNKKQWKKSDDIHQDTLIKCFVGMQGAETGISKSTADKIIDECFLPHLAA